MYYNKKMFIVNENGIVEKIANVKSVEMYSGQSADVASLKASVDKAGFSTAIPADLDNLKKLIDLLKKKQNEATTEALKNEIATEIKNYEAKLPASSADPWYITFMKTVTMGKFMDPTNKTHVILFYAIIAILVLLLLYLIDSNITHFIFKRKGEDMSPSDDLETPEEYEAEEDAAEETPEFTPEEEVEVPSPVTPIETPKTPQIQMETPEIFKTPPPPPPPQPRVSIPSPPPPAPVFPAEVKPVTYVPLSKVYVEAVEEAKKMEEEAKKKKKKPSERKSRTKSRSSSQRRKTAATKTRTKTRSRSRSRTGKKTWKLPTLSERQRR